MWQDLWKLRITAVIIHNGYQGLIQWLAETLGFHFHADNIDIKYDFIFPEYMDFTVAVPYQSWRLKETEI